MLLNKAKHWPNWFKNRNRVVMYIEELIKKLGRKSKVDLCLSYVKSFDWIDFIIVGVDSLNHLKEVIKNDFLNTSLKEEDDRFPV